MIPTKEEFHQKYILERIPINTLAKQFGISQHKMHKIKLNYGYHKGKNLPNPTKEELIEKFINQNKTIKTIAKEYHVGYNFAFNWLKKYKIKKPKDLLLKSYVHKGWEKGHSTWNKGMKGIYFKGSEKTWFTSEELSKKSEKNIGIPKIGSDKWLVCLTEDKRSVKNKRNDKVYQHRKREGYARYILKKSGIEIPKGYIVYHKDGDYTNNEIENLEIISRAELLKRNNKR